MHLALEFIGLCLGAVTAAFVLSLLWYKVTQRDQLDRSTVIFFIKLWYGIGTIGILVGLALKYG
jgi:hypothetical protein